LAGSTLKPSIKRTSFSNIASMRASKDIIRPLHLRAHKIYMMSSKKKTQGIKKPSNTLVTRSNVTGKSAWIKWITREKWRATYKEGLWESSSNSNLMKDRDNKAQQRGRDHIQGKVLEKTYLLNSSSFHQQFN
jgi:hypothetical protein